MSLSFISITYFCVSPKIFETNLLVIFDSSVILNLLKSRRFSLKISEELKLNNEDTKVFISSVTKGELSILQTTAKDKRRQLEALYNIFIEISPATREIIDYYSSLHIQNKKLGLNVSHNDLWIAATSNYLNIPLATCDGHFPKLWKNKLMNKEPLYFDFQKIKHSTNTLTGN